MRLRLIYTPDGGDRQEWIIRFDEFMSFEAEWIEEVGGSTWGSFSEFVAMLDRDNHRAYRALLWVMLRRQNPALEFEHVVFKLSEITFDVAEDEPESGKDDSDDSGTDSLSPQQDSAA